MAAVPLSALTLAMIPLKAINVVAPPEFHDKPTRIAGADLTAGTVVRQDGITGNVVAANSATAPNAAVDGIAWRDVKAGQAITVFKGGILDGFDLSGLAYGAKVYLQDAGGLGTTAGAVSTVVGEVVPGNATLLGTAADKLLRLTL